MEMKLSMDESVEYFEGMTKDLTKVQRFYRKFKNQRIRIPWEAIPQVQFAQHHGRHSYFFCHELLPRNTEVNEVSEYMPFFHGIVDEFMHDNKIKYDKITRSCLNLTYHIPERKWCDPHVDNYFNHYSVILYLNKVAGNTVVFDKTVPFDGKHEGIYYYDDYDWDNNPPMNIKYEATPEVGKIVLFRGDQLHAYKSTDPGDLRLVCVYNLSY
jgi:hypothetical protein